MQEVVIELVNYMEKYNMQEVVLELVNYMEKYHPEVLFMLRPENTAENRENGYRPGQPDIMILEPRYGNVGLALWVKSKMTKTDVRFSRRLYAVGYDTKVGDDADDLRLYFMMYIARQPCDPSRTDSRQTEIVEFLSHGITNRPTYSVTPDNDTISRITKFVKKEFPRSVIILGLGADDSPTMTIINPDHIHNGMAIWIGEAGRRYDLNTLSDRQFSYLKMMSDRSYLVVASEDLYKIRCAVSSYMRGYISGCSECPPRNCPINCPGVNLSNYPILVCSSECRNSGQQPRPCISECQAQKCRRVTLKR